jgi:hypothetical protein
VRRGRGTALNSQGKNSKQIKMKTELKSEILKRRKNLKNTEKLGLKMKDPIWNPCPTEWRAIFGNG